MLAGDESSEHSERKFALVCLRHHRRVQRWRATLWPDDNQCHCELVAGWKSPEASQKRSLSFL